MGIRCYCPNGHKLNIKAFQAGLRGICPRCGESFVIPRHSTRRSGKGRADEAAGSNEMSAGGDGSGRSAGSAVAAADHEVEISLHTVEENQEGPPPRYVSPPKPPEAPKPAVAKPDPIEEDPHAIWYVRPPTGGQFGPADGEVMRQWLTEGRISLNSLVWREGWEQWEEAMEVFPQLSPQSSLKPGDRSVVIPPLGVANPVRAKLRENVRAIQSPPIEEGRGWIWIVAGIILAGMVGAGLLIHWFLQF